MPVLIEALKDTARVYSEEEKAKVMGLGFEALSVRLFRPLKACSIPRV